MKWSSYVFPLLPLLLVSGCFANAVREKQAKLCADLSTLNDAIAVFKKISNSSTVKTLKQSEGNIGEAFRKLKVDAQDVENIDISKLEKTYKDLDKTIEKIPDKSTVAQAMTLAENKVATMESALTQTKTALKCSSASVQ